MEDFGGALDRYLAEPYERIEEPRDFECGHCNETSEAYANTGVWPCDNAECIGLIDTETDGPEPEEDCP